VTTTKVDGVGAETEALVSDGAVAIANPTRQGRTANP
jgi:hypothetical protein